MVSSLYRGLKCIFILGLSSCDAKWIMDDLDLVNWQFQGNFKRNDNFMF
jgi:hypothetical protein